MNGSCLSQPRGTCEIFTFESLTNYVRNLYRSWNFTISNNLLELKLHKFSGFELLQPSKRCQHQSTSASWLNSKRIVGARMVKMANRRFTIHLLSVSSKPHKGILCSDTVSCALLEQIHPLNSVLTLNTWVSREHEMPKRNEVKNKTPKF